MNSITRILVPVDFSAGTEYLVACGCQLAQALQAQLHLLHVVIDAGARADATGAASESVYEARVKIGKLPAEMPPPNVVLARIVRTGRPAHEILQYAREAGIDLIVMGSHGRSGLAHLLLGSIAETVIRESACPVTVVPRADQQFLPPPRPNTQALGQIAEAERSLELLRRAIESGATDVHLDPISKDEYSIRFRIDGRLENYCQVDRRIATPLIVQLKLLAHIDIAQPFAPHEGRVQLPEHLADVEVRLTTVPTCAGEALSLRILRNDHAPTTLQGLGLSPRGLAAIDQMLRDGEGLILVTGPTGAGKTTTVHALLRRLNNGARQIVSVEDPVEYNVPEIRQISVDHKHGLSLSVGMRTVLRMDPDVVFIGEIRDLEALDIAMRAASSGRYVFSTLHTRDAASTITALRDLHADNYSLAGNLKGIVCERLIRRLCQKCSVATEPTAAERQQFATAGLAPPSTLRRPAGCPACRQTGYHGRTGIFETVVITSPLALAIQEGRPEEELRRLIRESGSGSLTAAALECAREGVTSVEECLSIKWT
ncbi:MAG: Flp pilus assembly complex ATPase component TadA [Planctomycetes bacterium]|nr:Flp pilus assembly complex ATPase component TadA [Planctomycetota bacterium]